MGSPKPDFLRLERFKLQKETQRGGQQRYFVFFNDNDVHQFHAYIVGPDTGVYRFKLVKLHVKLPDQFPYYPPQVRFIHNTRHHIHPNFFPSGNICFSLIGYVNISCSSFMSCPSCARDSHLFTRVSSLHGSLTARIWSTDFLNDQGLRPPPVEEPEVEA